MAEESPIHVLRKRDIGVTYATSLPTRADADARYDAIGSAAAAQAASQPLDATLTALSGLDATAGLVEQTGADTFTKRAIGVGAATSVLTRADGDGRYDALGAAAAAQAASQPLIAFAANEFGARASTGAYEAKPITDFALSILDDADAAAVRATIGAGTVTSVAVADATGITWAGSPITTSGTLTPTLSANLQSWSGIAPASKADDSAVVHNTGTETVAGAKTFTSVISVVYSGSTGFQVETSNATNAVCRYSVNSGGNNVFAGQGTADVFAIGNSANLNAAANCWLRVSAASTRPGVDNSATCGASGARWSVVWAATGTISTSDEREKTDFRPFTPAEIAAARELSEAVGFFRWKDSVAKKGADAREHCGLTVQRAIEIMEKHGLDPFGYAFICFDQWDALPEVWNEWPDEYEGEKLVKKAGREKVQDFTPAGDRYSFRPDQLDRFIAKGLHERLKALEGAK